MIVTCPHERIYPKSVREGKFLARVELFCPCLAHRGLTSRHGAMMMSGRIGRHLEMFRVEMFIYMAVKGWLEVCAHSLRNMTRIDESKINFIFPVESP